MLIDAEGRVVAVGSGYSEAAMLAMERSIERALGAPRMGFDDTVLAGHRLVSARTAGPR